MRGLRALRHRRAVFGEQGVAMITAVLIGMVVLTISITATDLSIHNSNASALDRNRTLAIHAAEAGIDATLSLMQSTTSALLPCASPVVANLSTPIKERYSATVQYFTTYPPSGSPMSCPLSANGTPRSALVVSTGTVLPTGANPHIARTMASEVKLTPVFGGFKQAIFSDQSPNITNQTTVNGNVGNDANLYTNHDWICSNSGVDHGGIIAQGRILMSSSCYVYNDAWANGSVSLNNSATVNHDATSSTSSITLLNNTKINNNATAGTSVSAPAGAVKGVTTQNHVQSPPPPVHMPLYFWANFAIVAPDLHITTTTYTDCSAAYTFVKGLSSTTPQAVHIAPSPACVFTNTGNNPDTITMRGDIYLFMTGGSLDLSKITLQSSDTTLHNLYLIVTGGGDGTIPPPLTPTACTLSGAPSGYIKTANSTSFTNLRVFVFTPCSANIGNLTSGLPGQIIAGTVNITNNYTMNYFPFPTPGGGGVTGFSQGVVYLREVQNPPGS